MCGIVGYMGHRQAQQVLTRCLARLEYRGYDSCGIAVAGNKFWVVKDAVRVNELERTVRHISGTIGIGHTRWATHGEPCQMNAHPHCDCTGDIAVVHNGIITNYRVLKQRLTEGHVFKSETDSEVIPHLVEKYYNGNLKQAVNLALEELKGSYAIIVLTFGEKKLIAARQGSPLIVGIGQNENFLASDVPAILDYTNTVIYLEDGDIATLTDNHVVVESDGAEVERKENIITWKSSDCQKAGFDHYMLKEIREQPSIIRDTLAEYRTRTEPVADLLVKGQVPESLIILACGTSNHAAMVGKYLIQDLIGIPVMVELASEFNYCSVTALPRRLL